MKERQLYIVIADDDEDDQLLVKQAITEIVDAEMESVYNGFELLDLLKQQGKFRNKKPGTPDFILLDLNMPLLDGFGVLDRIKADKVLSEIPVYILSTSRMDHDKKKSKELGARGFYTKPILYDQLKAIIGEISAQHQTGGA
jgi:two-component system response regulator